MKEATLKLRASKLGPDHLDTLRTINSLARAYQVAGRLTDALPQFEGAQWPGRGPGAAGAALRSDREQR
jgi:hypothetical protein